MEVQSLYLSTMALHTILQDQNDMHFSPKKFALQGVSRQFGHKC